MLDLQATYVQSKVTYKYKPFMRNYIWLKPRQNQWLKPIKLHPKFAHLKTQRPETYQTKVSEPPTSVFSSTHALTDFQTTSTPGSVIQPSFNLTNDETKINPKQATVEDSVRLSSETVLPSQSTNDVENKISSTLAPLKELIKQAPETHSSSLAKNNVENRANFVPTQKAESSTAQTSETLSPPQALTSNSENKARLLFEFTENMEPN